MRLRPPIFATFVTVLLPMSAPLRAADGVYEVLAEFVRPGLQPQSKLLQQSDGSFFFTASVGGAQDSGAILHLTSAGGLETAVSFTGLTGEAPGRSPLAGLTPGPDGALWGSTVSGGAGDFGTIYRFVPGVGLVSVVSFTGSSGVAPGSVPNGLFAHTDGKFYTTTLAGGTGGLGSMIQVSTAGAVTSQGSFTGTTGVRKGSSPVGSLVHVGTKFYGVTRRGGASDLGTVFSQTDAGVFKTEVEFTGSAGGSLGAQPLAGLLAHTDGNLYGTCSAGGTQGFGTVFKMSPSGSLSVLHHFFDTDGSTPSAAVVQGTDGALYGTTANGGAAGWGVVYKCTTSGTFTVLAEFTGTSGVRPGASSLAALTLGGDGNFYGATSAGGPGNDGGVFQITPAGAYTRMAECSGILGWAPSGAPASDGLGNWFLPMAAGGAGGGGTLLERDAFGGLSVAGVFGGTFGDQPAGGVLMDAGAMYGVTAAGGNTGRGTSFRLAGGTLTVLNQHTNAQGAAADGPLVKGVDGNFYGVAREGGASSRGSIFKITATGVRTRMVSFSGTAGAVRGSLPKGPLALGNDGDFYGATTNGGVADQGVLFRVTPGGVYSLLYEFTTIGPRLPQGGLKAGADGLIYGTTGAGGPADGGTVFSLTTGGVFNVVVSFTGLAGELPGDTPESLSLGADGSLWGLTRGGGASDQGTIFQRTPDGIFHSRFEFSGTTGSAAGPLTLAQTVKGGIAAGNDNWCYGAVPGGGLEGGGMLFRVRAPTAFEIWQGTILKNVPPEDAADLADPDGDGMNNLVEYALGTQPLTADHPLEPALVHVSGDSRLSLTLQRDSSRNDITIALEAATNPADPWEIISTSANGGPFTGPAPTIGDGSSPGMRNVMLCDTVVSSAQFRRFLRFRITRPTPPQ